MKNITILSMSQSAAEGYKKTVLDVFGADLFTVDTVIIGRDEITKDADVYLVPKGYVESRLGTDINNEFAFPLGIPIIDLVVEFRTEDVKPLFDLPAETKCLLVNSTEMLAMECISDLHNVMGIYHLTLFPLGRNAIFYGDGIDTAITIGEPELVPSYISNIIDLGARSISPETFVEIATALKCEELLETDKFNEYKDKFAGGSQRYSAIISNSFYYKNFLSLMIERLDEGIIGISEEYKIFCANAKALDVLGEKGFDFIGANAVDAIPFVDFGKYKMSRKSDRFISVYRGTELNVFISSIILNDNFKGFLLVIQKFYEEENKQNKARLQLLERGHKAKYTFDDIIGNSSAIRATCELAKKMALSNSTVLITGETGTGKELLAGSIHNYSNRKEGPYIAVNCAAMPENLLESELFGYDEGAFTGAKKSGKLGFFEYAHRGTLFLDEIEDMSNLLQLKLLRVLQEKEIMHVGGNKVIKVDVRIIAATNQNLQELVNQKKIRKDLYYRLNALQIELPPLRERREDIIPIAEHMMLKAGAAYSLSDEVKDVLISHEWDGNVRELQNYVEYFSCIHKFVIDVYDLPKALRVEGRKQINAEEEILIKILYKAFKDKEHIGRKRLSELSIEQNVFLSEQQIRGVLVDLSDKGMVEISKGRGGTYLTPKGVSYCKERLNL